MRTTYSRVTVVSPERTIDLSLPSALPLAEIVPQLMRYAVPRGHEQASWSLARVGGNELPLNQSLGDVGVLDGDVLELRADGQSPGATVISDVRDAIEDIVDTAGGAWRTLTTRSFIVLVGTAVPVLMALVVSAARLTTAAQWSMEVNSLATAITLALALGYVTWWASVYARDIDTQVAAGGAMVWGAMLGLAVGDLADLGPWVGPLIGAACAAAIAAILRVITPAVTGHVAFGVLLLVAASVCAAAQAWSVAAEVIPRVLPVLAVLAVGAIPRVSLAVGGLANAEFRVRSAGVLDAAVLRARYRASNALVVGSVAALGVMIALTGTALAMSPSVWDRTLSAALAVGVVLRSRVFSRIQHLVVLRAVGCYLAVLPLTRWSIDEPDMAPWVGVIIAVVVFASVGLASLQPNDASRARLRRVLNVAEFLGLIVILVVLVGALSVYGQADGSAMGGVG